MPETSHSQFLEAWKRAQQVSAKPETEMKRVTLGTDQPPVPKRSYKKLWMGLGIFLGIFLVLASVVGVAGYGVYRQVAEIQADAQDAMVQGRGVYDSFKAQNLDEAQTRLVKTQEKLKETQVKFQKLSWLGKVPFASTYYNDGEHGFVAAIAGTNAGIKVLAAVAPNADVLGFKGQGTFAGGTTEDRIGLILKTLGEITPVLDSVSSDVKVMQENLAQIDPKDYPETLKGKPIRNYITQAKTAADTAESALTDARPVLEQLPAIAGAKGRKKYLVLFQNNNELRPTGGFLTAYAVVFVENGKVSPEKSDDIYELDKKFSKKPAIPPQLGRFLTTESKWNLRDMNIDPNFESSMKTFYSYYQQIKGEPANIDGIIAVDTDILEKIVAIVGPIEVPGYGTFSTQKVPQCDCAQIIYALSEIIDRPTPYQRENRKGILAPLMQSILARTYATSHDKWPQLADLMWKSIEGRHVQMYFFNPDFQAAAKSINAAGIIPQMPKDGGDYLTVIDANLAGAKSNLFVTTSIEQKIVNVTGGRVQKEVELTYRNTHAPSNCNLEKGELCLNGLLNDWTRWYLPKGVKVDEVLGLEAGYKVDTTNADFDVLEGIFRLSPMSQTKVRVTYSAPYSVSKGYVLHMQKQGGTDAMPLTVTTPWGEQETVFDKDLTVKVGQ